MTSLDFKFDNMKRRLLGLKQARVSDLTPADPADPAAVSRASEIAIPQLDFHGEAVFSAARALITRVANYTQENQGVEASDKVVDNLIAVLEPVLKATLDDDDNAGLASLAVSAAGGRSAAKRAKKRK